ncbi:MAG: HAD family hydrolase [Pseudomonadota bacterium]
MRVVMWSGPRNLSTALMRSFGARSDADVVDEPFYAAYLAATGLDHPMRDAILAAQPADWAQVAAACAAPPPPGRVRYEKHMTHHMIPGAPLDWMRGAAVAFLIRDPAEVAASYAAKRRRFRLDDLGFERQAQLFEHAQALLGRPPPVVDAADIRRAPRRTLAALCAALGLPFDPAMLAWPPGRRASDGVWAAHWYGAVEASTGFAPPGPPPRLCAETDRLIAPARALYRDLHARRLAPA